MVSIVTEFRNWHILLENALHSFAPLLSWLSAALICIENIWIIQKVLDHIYEVFYSLGNYLPKRKGVSAYISDVYAYISDFANRPENECCYLGKINSTI